MYQDLFLVEMQENPTTKQKPPPQHHKNISHVSLNNKANIWLVDFRQYLKIRLVLCIL